ncbi:MAG: hypothetical protein ACLTMR_10330 [Faecalibacillus sp.]
MTPLSTPLNHLTASVAALTLVQLVLTAYVHEPVGVYFSWFQSFPTG